MNFYQHQDRAKKNSLKLIVLFSLGVISLIITLSILIGAIIIFLDGGGEISFKALLYAPFFHKIVVIIALAVVFIVFVGMYIRRHGLKGGGKIVAASLGGKLLTHDNAKDLHEKKVLNVVEEMAIASGIPVPSVFVLQEDTINAFAAGDQIDNAVIGVTKGCITLLKRDELQGVIAHEFSHIFHGDMALNIKIVSWLHGILLLGDLGFKFIRSTSRTRTRSNSKDGKGVAVIYLIGLALIVGGYVGAFFGGLIKSALSRQREYLADASAVQYTRNPYGIASALKKINTHTGGSIIQNSKADEFSHMFFGDIMGKRLTSLFATHPPLVERITRIEPSWNGVYSKSVQIVEEANEMAKDEKKEDIKKAVVAGTILSKQNVLSSVEGVGTIMEQNVKNAQAIIAKIDEKLLNAAHEPYLARVVVWLILFDKDTKIAAIQESLLPKEEKKDSAYTALKTLIAKLNIKGVIPLVEISIPALKTLSPKQYEDFKKVMLELIKADEKVNLFEWSLYSILTKSIEGVEYRDKDYKLIDCIDELKLLFSLLCNASNDKDNIQKAYKNSLKTLGISEKRYDLIHKVQFSQLESALKKMLHLSPMQKLRVIRQMVECVSHDGTVNQKEFQLLKAVSYSLDVALPMIEE